MKNTQRIAKIAGRISDMLSEYYSWVKSQVESLYKLAYENLPVFWENIKSFLFKFIRKLKQVLIMINNFLDMGKCGNGTTTEFATTEDQEKVVESTEANEKMSLKELWNDCIIIVKESRKLLKEVAPVVRRVEKWKHNADGGLNKIVDLMGGVFDLAEQTIKNPFSSLMEVVHEIANNEKDNSDSSSRVSKLQGNGALVVREMLSLMAIA